MKSTNDPEPKPSPSKVSRPTSVPKIKKGARPPDPGEVAGRAYANFLNHGSSHGHDVEDWMKAEAQLQEERNLIRVAGGGFPNQD